MESGYLFVLLVGETKYLCLFVILVLTGHVGAGGIWLVVIGMMAQYVVTCYDDRESFSSVNLFWVKR